MTDSSKISLIAFDADDTLWDNEPFFRGAESRMLDLLSKYVPRDKAYEGLFRTELENMKDYGFGAISFTMSMVENAIRVTEGRITAEEISEIISYGRELLHVKATPLAGVRETLQAIRDSRLYRMILMTKGELLTQTNKLKRSGLSEFFDRYVILCDKKEEDYLKLCREEGVAPENILMVGNSLKSDMLPALNTGAQAVYIPYEIMWDYERIESFNHPRMAVAERFSDLTGILGIHTDGQ